MCVCNLNVFATEITIWRIWKTQHSTTLSFKCTNARSHRHTDTHSQFWLWFQSWTLNNRQNIKASLVFFTKESQTKRSETMQQSNVVPGFGMLCTASVASNIEPQPVRHSASEQHTIIIFGPRNPKESVVREWAIQLIRCVRNISYNKTVLILLSVCVCAQKIHIKIDANV